jgi:hypothetical protein
LINSEVWAPLGDAAAGLQALDDRQMRDIQQVFDQDLAALLSYLGYRPPPPAHHMELELRDAVEHALLDVRMRDVAPMTTIRAKNSLYVFAYRLRRLTRQAEHDLKDNDEVNGPQRLAVAARDLRAVTLTAVRAAGPSAIAAAATALVFPPAAAALGMNAATEAAKEAVKRLVELGGLSVLTRLLAEDVSTAPREAMLSGAAAGTAAWMTDLAATAIDLALDDRTARSRRIEPICIASISASYGVLQAAALVSGPTEAIKETCQRAIDVAQQVRQLVDDGATYGGDRRRVP